MDAWSKSTFLALVLAGVAGCVSTPSTSPSQEQAVLPTGADAVGNDQSQAWAFSEVGGDCPAAYEFAESASGNVVASDYCSGFDSFYVGIAGRVVSFDALDSVEVYGPEEGWNRRYAGASGELAELRIGKLIRKEYDPQSTDEGCTRRFFAAKLLITPTDGVPREVDGVLDGGCP